MGDVAPEPKSVGVRELRANLSALLREARQGRSIRVVSRGQVLAEIHPPTEQKLPPRKLGTLKGKIWIAPDFDETPLGIIEAMEGD